MTDLSLPYSRLFRTMGRRVVRLGRWRAALMLAIASMVGLAGGVVVFLVGRLTALLHALLYAVADGGHLSEEAALHAPWMAVVPLLGGAMLGVSIILARRFRTRPPVDPIEANAIHGGLMSFRESVIVTAQTVISSGFGASVGLEAGYTQLSASLGSRLGKTLRLRRHELRLLVGCGAAAAIAAAFDAPFTGAFYAFELIIGVYSIGTLAPVIAAALCGSFLAHRLGALQSSIALGIVPTLSARDVIPFFILGMLCAVLAIGLMLSVAMIERGFSRLKIAQPIRPAIGGVIVGGMALVTPAVLSTGHGALEAQISAQTGLAWIAALFALKFVASSISLGAGFRGGLFFASLLMGALFGKLFGTLVALSGLAPNIDPTLAIVVGMASLAAGVVGGPLTMTFLVLETTGDLTISAAVMVAAAISVFMVRELFGYSFSTWRFHLRGENIHSPHDVGRVRNLTVGKMMRLDVRKAGERMTLVEFRSKYPLGSTKRVVVTDAAGKYVGVVLVADAFQPHVEEEPPDQTIAGLVRYRDTFLLPGLNAADAAPLFQKADSEELAVVDNLGNRNVVGLLTEAHLLRRYSEELDKGLKDLTG